MEEAKNNEPISQKDPNPDDRLGEKIAAIGLIGVVVGAIIFLLLPSPDTNKAIAIHVGVYLFALIISTNLLIPLYFRNKNDIPIHKRNILLWIIVVGFIIIWTLLIGDICSCEFMIIPFWFAYLITSYALWELSKHFKNYAKSSFILHRKYALSLLLFSLSLLLVISFCPLQSSDRCSKIDRTTDSNRLDSLKKENKKLTFKVERLLDSLTSRSKPPILKMDTQNNKESEATPKVPLPVANNPDVPMSTQAYSGHIRIGDWNGEIWTEQYISGLPSSPSTIQNLINQRTSVSFRINLFTTMFNSNNRNQRSDGILTSIPSGSAITINRIYPSNNERFWYAEIDYQPNQ